FFDVKGDVEALLGLTQAGREFGFSPAAVSWLHPGQSAVLQRGEKPVGYVGALHPDRLKALDLDEDVYVFELDVGLIDERPLPRAAAISRYPSVRRDLSFELPEAIPYAKIEASVSAAVGDSLRQIVVFDRYSGHNLRSGVKSLAIGLILQNSYRTLT